MDLRGVTGIDPDVRNGCATIRLAFDVKGDADDEKLRALVEQATRRSAVHDVLTRGVDVRIAVNG